MDLSFTTIPLAIYFFKSLYDLKQLRSDLTICYTQPTYQPNELNPSNKQILINGLMYSNQKFKVSPLVNEYLNTSDLIREMVIKQTSFKGPKISRFPHYIIGKLMSNSYTNGVKTGYLQDVHDKQVQIPFKTAYNTIFLEGIYDKKIINSVTHEKDNMFTRFLKRIPLIGRIFRYFFKVEVTITDTIMGVTSGNLVTMLVDLPKVKVVGGNLKEIVDYLKKQQKEKIWGLIICGWFLYLQLNRIMDRIQKNKVRSQQKKEQLTQSITLQHTTSKLMKDPKDETICIICCSRARSLIFKPCLHYIICKECKDKIQNKKCPVCREQIEDIIHVIIE